MMNKEKCLVRCSVKSRSLEAVGLKTVSDLEQKTPLIGILQYFAVT
jgi:hypothetical protein